MIIIIIFYKNLLNFSLFSTLTQNDQLYPDYVKYMCVQGHV